MKRLLKVGFSLLALKKALSFGDFFAATKFDLGLKKEAKLNFLRALVLAPHPDDDAFGLGGTIKKMATAGTAVTVVYFCDGSSGGKEGSGKDESLIFQRKTEAEKAAKVLGVKELVFWGYPDGKLASGTSVIRALQDLLEKIKPEIIFLPSFLDNHGDHRVTNEIFINAVGGLLKPATFEVWAYEIWTPIFINRLVDISLYIKTKNEAISCHHSQLEARGYEKAMLGLSQYRAEINNLAGFAEGFFAAPFELYRQLYRKS